MGVLVNVDLKVFMPKLNMVGVSSFFLPGPYGREWRRHPGYRRSCFETSEPSLSIRGDWYLRRTMSDQPYCQHLGGTGATSKACQYEAMTWLRVGRAARLPTRMFTTVCSP